jgi:hypothetical protein
MTHSNKSISLLRQHMDDAMKPTFKPSPVELNQRLLYPSNVFDLLDTDHEYYL